MSRKDIFIRYKNNDNISLPLNENGNLSLNVLKQYYPDAQGLTYATKDGQKHGLNIQSDEIIIKEAIHYYDVHCALDNLREPINKRKHALVGEILDKLNKKRNLENKSNNQQDNVAKINKKKKLRTIQVGWLYRKASSESYRQMKKPLGGKKESKLYEPSIYTAEDIKQLAIQEFATHFPSFHRLDVNLGTFDGDCILSFKTEDNDDDDFWSYVKSQKYQLSRLNLYLLTTDKEKSSKPITDNLHDKDLINAASSSVKSSESSSLTYHHSVLSTTVEESDSFSSLPIKSENPSLSVEHESSIHLGKNSGQLINQETSTTQVTVCIHSSGDSIEIIDENSINIRYEYIIISKYSGDISIAYLSKEALYNSALEDVGHISLDEFDPIDHGYRISTITANGKDLLAIYTNENMTRTFTFPSSEVTDDGEHYIVHDVAELSGKCDGVSGCGVVTSCTDECQPVFTWYEDGKMKKQGKFLYWLSNTLDGHKYTCDVSCKQNSTKKTENESTIPVTSSAECSTNILKQNYLWVPEVERSELTITGKILGAGAQGTVRQGNWLGTDVAIKIIPVSKLNYKTVSREICVLQSVRHPNIIQIMGLCAENDRFFIIMELFDGSSLENYIFNEYDDVYDTIKTIDEKNKIGKQICQTMNYLHRQINPVIHGDVKLSNILINTRMTVKICDLGLSKFTSMTKSLKSTMFHNKPAQGTIMYMAPELLLNNTEATVASDVWSVGCALVELYSEKYVWNVTDENSLKSIIKQKSIPDLSLVPEPLVKALSQCFEYEPRSRTMISNILDIYLRLE